MKVRELKFESVDRDQLAPIKISRQRGVYRSVDDGRVYKLWEAGWEFGDRVEIGFEQGCYDEQLVPNLAGLLKDERGKNRGYVMDWVVYERRLEFIGWYYARKKIKAIGRGDFPAKEVLLSSHRMKREWLVKLMSVVFRRALETGWLFMGIDLKNLWVGDRAYHLFDLDALRQVDWLFADDEGDPERERKKLNREVINRELKLITSRHGIDWPIFLDSRDQLLKAVRQLST